MATSKTKKPIEHGLDFKEWLAKTKGLLAVAVYDPLAGGYIEGYVQGPIKTAEEVDFLPYDHPQVAWRVRVENLAPTGRLFYDKDGRVTHIPVRLGRPTSGTVLRYLRHSGRKNVTYKELCTALGRDIRDEVNSLKEYVRIGETRPCSIDGQPAPTIHLKERIMPVTPVSSIADLKDQFRNCTACRLGLERMHRGVPETCQGRGFASARALIIGEAPGRIEESTGIVFHPDAPAGKVLYKVMRYVGLDQKDFYIDNAVCCRPLPQDPSSRAENGKPEAEHMLACSSRLKALYYLLRPKVVILLGSYAYAAWYGEHPQRLGGLVGWQEGQKPRVYVMYHPAYYVRKAKYAEPEAKKKLVDQYIQQWKEIAEAL